MIALFVLALPAVSSLAQKEDTADIQERAYKRSAAMQGFIVAPYANAALNYYRHSFSFSTLSVSGDWNDYSRAVAAEQGEGWKGFRISAESYVRMSGHSRIWGNARYRNGVRKNVQWNESADYNLLYPYVAADTIGGDLKSETYFFEGGYAAAWKRWTFGGGFSYRALQEYREIDPRPYNRVADLQGNIGASLRLANRYAIGLSAEAHKYKQSGELAYYNELGVSKTFHLTGLGSSYTRFDGTNTSVRYQGHAYGTGIHLLSTDKKGGWNASVNYLSSFYEKRLPAMNELTLNELDEDRLQGEMAWTRLRRRSRLGIKAQACYSNRQGTEVIYGDAVNHVYPQIATARQFGSKAFDGSLSALYEQEPTDNRRWSVHPSVGYRRTEESYNAPSKRMEYSLLNARLILSSTRKWKNDRLDARLWGMHRHKLDAALHASTALAHPYALTVLQQNLEMQSGGRNGYGLSMRWSKRMPGNMLAYLETGWQQSFYASAETDRSLWVNIGLSL